MANIIKASLNYQSINVDVAKNGVEAIDKVLNNHYDLVILDINMPYMDGRETVTYIKEQCPNIKIAAFTVERSPADLESYFKLGFDDVIEKPIHLEEFHNRVSTLLNSNMPKAGEK